MENRMSKKSTTGQPALIVFGEDEDLKTRAGWFKQEDVETAQKAAAQLGFHCLPVDNDHILKIACDLKAGNPHGPGKRFIPVVKTSAFVTLLDVVTESNAAATPTPRDWEAIKTGDLIIAHEGKTEGWWEAIVIKRKDDNVTIRWRDYPKQPKVQRHRSQIAFLPAG
jgi:hypothetical protein